MNFLRPFSVLLIILFRISPLAAQDNCAEITSITIHNLVPLLQKNDIQNILTNLNTIESTCGQNEFTLRTRIIYQIINRENTDKLLEKYLDNKYDVQLIKRWDDASTADFANLYGHNRKQYNYVPLRHYTDSLLKVKAIALLNSTSYSNIPPSDIAILYLFADDIDRYLDLTKSTNIVNHTVQKFEDIDQLKEKHTFGVHTGIFMPIGENYYFGKSVTGGVSVMSPFIHDFVFDLHYKFRVHQKAPAFYFKYKEEIREVSANSSHVLAIGVGYKLLDKNRFIILPKLNVGYGIIWTGLSETVYGEDDDGNETETRRYRNVQTLHSSLGISIMRHISKKTYVGVESNVHLIPYNWDSRLKSTIPSKYASFELFVRF